MLKYVKVQLGSKCTAGELWSGKQKTAGQAAKDTPGDASEMILT